jgi:ABC-type sugar transport system permease subunit
VKWRRNLDDLPALIVLLFLALCAVLGGAILIALFRLWFTSPLAPLHKAIADTPHFWQALKNTTVLFIGSFALQLFFAILGTFWVRSVPAAVKVLLVLPYAVGVVAPAFSLYVFLSPALGPLSSFSFAISDNPLGARLVVVFLDSWQWTGILLLACFFKLEQLPDSHFELARLERASRLRIWTKIVWPTINGVVLLFFFVRAIDWFRKVDTVKVPFGQGGPGYSVETLAMYVSQNYYYSGGRNYAAFLTLVQMVLLGLMLMIVFRVRIRGWLTDEE